MVVKIRENDPYGLNKGRRLKFCVVSRVRQEILEEGRTIYRQKRCECNIKDEDNSSKTQNDRVLLYKIKS